MSCILKGLIAFFFGWMVCGFLVSVPRIKAMFPGLEALSLNYWTTP